MLFLLFCYLFSIFTFISNAVDITVNLPFCDETAIHEQYILQEPPPCIKPKTLATHQCQAKIFNPSTSLNKLKTYSCKIQRKSYHSTFYFFGTKQHEITTSPDPPPSLESCHSWITQKRSLLFGNFKQITKNVWTTTNELDIKYIWPTTTSGFVLNAYLTEFISYYDPIKKLMTGTGEIMSHCKFDAGNCISRLSRIVWTPSSQFQCPKYDYVNDHNMLLHYDDNNILHHIEIPTLDMSLHHLDTCGSEIRACYKPPIFCDPGKLLIQPHNCSKLNNFISLESKPTKPSETASRKRKPLLTPYSRMLNDLSDHFSSQIRNQSLTLAHAFCQQSRTHALLLKAIDERNPSEVFSNLLNRTVLAKKSGDVYLIYGCKLVNASLIPSLYMNHSKFATRPLFFVSMQEAGVNGGQHCQLRPDHRLTTRISFTTPYHHNHYQVFNIEKHFYVFENFSLTRQSHQIHKLYPTIYKFPIKSQNFDFTEADLNLPHDNSFDDFISTLQQINILQDNQAIMKRQMQLSSAIPKKGNNNISPLNVHYWTSAFLDPVISFINHYLQTLSYFWGQILTFYCLYKICYKSRRRPINYIMQHVNRFRTANSPSNDPPEIPPRLLTIETPPANLDEEQSI